MALRAPSVSWKRQPNRKVHMEMGLQGGPTEFQSFSFPGGESAAWPPQVD